MIPQKRSPIVQIPLTFDSSSKPQGLTNDKFYLSLLVFGVWIFCAIVFIISALTISEKFLYVIGSFILSTLIIRFLLMREPYFKKKREDLVEKDFQYPHSVFWNIYEVTNSYPHICRYANGLKSVFVVFDKDVIVGREQDDDYFHYEAIADAYLQMYKRGIDCMHIDYMDTVGKDDRVNSSFDLANNAENKDLKEILTRMFDNVEYIMEHSYASYDVYCFYYKGKDELFMDELDVVLDAFLEANYIRYRILDKNEIGELVKSVFNITDFSVKEASEKLFTDLGGTHYLTPIWVERETSNGVERKILNPTMAEIQKQKETKEEERKIKKGMKKIKKGQDFDLEDYPQFNNYQNGYQNDYQNDYQNEVYSNSNPYYNNMPSYEEEVVKETPQESDFAFDMSNIDLGKGISNTPNNFDNSEMVWRKSNQDIDDFDLEDEVLE
jgi:hypothetical protein